MKKKIVQHFCLMRFDSVGKMMKNEKSIFFIQSISNRKSFERDGDVNGEHHHHLIIQIEQKRWNL